MGRKHKSGYFLSFLVELFMPICNRYCSKVMQISIREILEFSFHLLFIKRVEKINIENRPQNREIWHYLQNRKEREVWPPKIGRITVWWGDLTGMPIMLNPLYTNGIFLLVWYNKLGIAHCTYLGVSGYSFHKILHSFAWKCFFPFTNSVHPDEMQYYAAFHLGLHFLQKVFVCLIWFKSHQQ